MGQIIVARGVDDTWMIYFNAPFATPAEIKAVKVIPEYTALSDPEDIAFVPIRIY